MEGLVLKCVEIQDIENYQDMEIFLDVEIIPDMEAKHHKLLHPTTIFKRKQIYR